MSLTERVAALLHAALLEEVRATPKPGLVDLHDSGVHTDMDAKTFAASAAAVAPHLGRMFALGLVWADGPEALFGAIRPVGREAERAMRSATDGVNTHKGAIFTLGILAAAAGLAYRRTGAFESGTLLDLSREMTAAPLRAELAALSRRAPATHGERLYAATGRAGVRGEAMAGFPALRDAALPALADARQPSRERRALRALLRLMAVVEDSTVLHRAGTAGLCWMHGRAAAFLAAWPVLTDEAMAELAALNEAFIQCNISPGGCADLLAAALFLNGLSD